MSDEDLVGRAIDGKYTIVRLIGRGGMGSVYEGRNIQTHKRVAIKLLSSPELVHNPDLVRRFFQEARAGAIIESEHVVQVYDSGTDPQSRMPYMVMELLQGEDLDACVKRLHALPPAVAARIVLQAAAGLAKAHALDIVHRDIKPANLFLARRENGELTVKLLDFGVAKVRMQHFQETQAGLTATGSLLGTPIYMSPEQAKGRAGVEAASDVWSLGVVLYELLSGQLPYTEATTLGELIISICTEDIPLLQDRAAWVPPELAEVTHRSMSRDVAQRYQDAGQLRDALAALLPDGARLSPEMFTSVSETQRALIMPRLAFADSGMLRARSRDGLAVTQTVGRASNTGLVVALVVTLLVVLTGGAVLFWRMSKKAPVATAPSSAPIVLLVSAGGEPPRPPAPKKYKLVISPATARVLIDGRETSVTEDSVAISGLPGDTRIVRVEHEGKSRQAVVVVTGSGLVPSSVELGKTQPAGASPKPKPGVKPAVSEPVKTTKPKPKLENEWPG